MESEPREHREAPSQDTLEEVSENKHSEEGIPVGWESKARCQSLSRARRTCRQGLPSTGSRGANQVKKAPTWGSAYCRVSETEQGEQHISWRGYWLGWRWGGGHSAN